MPKRPIRQKLKHLFWTSCDKWSKKRNLNCQLFTAFDTTKKKRLRIRRFAKFEVSASIGSILLPLEGQCHSQKICDWESCRLEEPKLHYLKYWSIAQQNICHFDLNLSLNWAQRSSLLSIILGKQVSLICT